LNTERDTYNGQAQDETTDQVFEEDEYSAKNNPDNVSYKVHVSIFVVKMKNE